MLRRLTVRDFVIVDRLDLEFGEGFGALTGETGAGKSILLDALGLALGGRGDAAMVRNGCERADISAEFDLSGCEGLRDWLSGQDIPVDDDTLLLRRTIDSSGRSRAWISGVPATLAQLREAGDWLADIHGQHAHHALLRGETQRALLDAQAGAGRLAAEVGQAWRAWQDALARREAAERDAHASERERDLLAWQIEEFDRLGFDREEWERLQAEQGRLAHAAGLMEGADEALNLIGDEELSALPLLRRVEARLHEMASVDPQLAETGALVAEAVIQADEALHALRRYRERLDPDPQRLAEIDQRIGAVTDLARKHRVAPEDLADQRQRWAEALSALEARSDPQRLAEQEGQARDRYRKLAAQLSDLRRPAAERLSREVSEAMQNLAMAGGKFEVSLESLVEGAAHGSEDVTFCVAANPNQPLRPLAKVASGGELSRIGLAIQVMTSRNVATPTLIFDEVDVGIGGAVAEIVGRMLHRLGRDRQVLCVTHLPQVAACADWQWSISKRTRGAGVVSEVTLLDTQGRIDEIARMLGGVELTETTRRHAMEMIGSATQG